MEEKRSVPAMGGGGGEFKQGGRGLTMNAPLQSNVFGLAAADMRGGSGGVRGEICGRDRPARDPRTSDAATAAGGRVTSSPATISPDDAARTGTAGVGIQAADGRDVTNATRSGDPRGDGGEGETVSGGDGRGDSDGVRWRGAAAGGGS